MRNPFEGAATACFRGLVGLWPADLRAAYGSSAVATFAQRLHAARRGGRGRLAVVAARELVGAAALAVRSRLPGGRTPRVPTPATPHSVGGGLGQDLRFALRTIRHHPGFAAAVLVMLCLGIGLNVATVGLLDAVLLRPLPFPEADRLVSLWSTRDGEPTRFGNLSWLDLRDYRDSLPAFAALGGFSGSRPLSVTFGAHPEVATAARATPGFFESLRVAPVLGRLLRPEDMESGGVVLLAEGAWERRFARDRAVLGRSIDVDGAPHEIVGVVPDTVAVVGGPAEIWLPEVPGGQSRGSRNLNVVGRLATGIAPESAQSRVDALADSLAARFADSNQGIGARVRPLRDQIVGEVAPRILLLLQGGALALLLICCANVANLYLARGVTRRREVAVMRAMGASAVRIARPLLFEAILLAGCGATLGVGLAAALPGLLRRLGAGQLPRLDEIAVDARLLAMAGCLALAVACVAAVVPAWSDARRGLRDALTATGPGASGARGSSRRMLVVLQVAGAVVLVFVAGLLLKSLRTLADVDPGFDPTDSVAVSLRLSGVFSGADEAMAFAQRAGEALAALPGVRHVGGVSMLPLAGGNLCDDAAVEGSSTESDCVEYRSVTPGYFAAMGINLLAGRTVRPTDRQEAPPVAVVNRAFARLFFGDASALGARLEGRGGAWEIVGVVADVHHFGLDAAPRPEAYLPYAQAPFPLLTLVVRTEPGVEVPEAAIRDTLWSVEPRLAMPPVQPLSSLVASSISAPRARGLLFSGFGLVALLLAMGGIAGALACDVRQRQREIGIRMALGGGAGSVRALVLGDALRLTGFGLLVGAAAAVLVGRTLESFLFEIGLLDGEVVALTLLVLVATAGLAAWAPARGATRVDPAVTLREE